MACELFSLCSGVGQPDDCCGGEGFEPHDRARGVVAGRSPHGMMPPGHLRANQDEDVVGRACRRACLGRQGRGQLTTRDSGETIHSAQAGKGNTGETLCGACIGGASNCGRSHRWGDSVESLWRQLGTLGHCTRAIEVNFCNGLTRSSDRIILFANDCLPKEA